MYYNWQPNGCPNFEFNEEEYNESDLLLIQVAEVSGWKILANTAKENQ